MSRKVIFQLTLTLILSLTIAGSANAAGQTLNQLGAEIMETMHAFYPVQATSLGIHAYDHRFTDYSSGSVKQMINKLTDYEKRLYKYKSASLSTHDQINYRLLKSNVDIALQDLKKIEWYKKSPHIYVDDAINGLYYLILSNHAPLSERLVSIMNRMRATEDLFATARKNIRKPSRLHIEITNGMLEDAMAFYKDVAAELARNFPERADEIMRVSTKAREAMNDFLIYLSGLTPGPDTDIAIGKNNFDYKLANQYFIDYDSDSLLKIGLDLFDKVNREYHDYVAYVDSSHQNGTDAVFVPATFTKQDVMDYYNWETQQEKMYLEANDLVTIPEGVASVSVVETPPFMRTMVGMYAYQPAGPFDSQQQGYFYVRPIPDDIDRAGLEARYRYVHRRGFKGAVVHEAYPGHHLQMQLAGLNSDPIRKFQSNFLLIEGWALYCEEMMYDEGLYGNEDPAAWLSILDLIRFRAARIVADVKLHTGQWTYDECVAWMIEAMGITSESGKQYIESEVLRYLITPTHQMAYLIGKTEIMKLREAAQKRDGDSFSLKKFHDALLAEGSISPTLMWDIMGLSKN